MQRPRGWIDSKDRDRVGILPRCQQPLSARVDHKEAGTGPCAHDAPLCQQPGAGIDREYNDVIHAPNGRVEISPVRMDRNFRGRVTSFNLRREK